VKPHPLAEIFPPLEGEEFSALAEDIKANGLRSPVVLFEGKILDGRNRWKACERIGVKPKTIEYRGDDPLGYVISLNLNRRHLTPGQRAMVAEKIVTATHGGHRHGQVKGSRDPLTPEVTRDEAAGIAGASTGTMKRVRTVLDRGTKQLQDAVATGKIEPAIAAKLTEATPVKQREAAAGGKEVAREIAKQIEKTTESAPPVRTLGLTVPPELMARIEKEQGLLDKMSRGLSELKRNFTEWEAMRGVGKLKAGQHFSSSFRTAVNELNLLRGQRPASICPHCKLIPELQKTCASCRSIGFIGANDLEQVEKCLLAEGDDAGVWVGGQWKSYASLVGDDF
jgi:ParB-like chromosome segregation protein Spo0J